MYKHKQVLIVMSSWLETAEGTHPGHAHKLCSSLFLAVWVTWTLELDLDYDSKVNRCKPV